MCLYHLLSSDSFLWYFRNSDLFSGKGSYSLSCDALNWTVPYIAAFIGDGGTDSDDTVYSLSTKEFTFSINSVKFNSVARDIKKSFPDFNETPERMLVITWKNIPRFNRDNFKRNTFQSIIVASRTATFLVLYYNKIDWYGRGVAISHGHRHYCVPGSCTSAMQNIAGLVILEVQESSSTKLIPT